MMKFKKIIIIMLSLLFLTGCSAENTTYPNGGDNGNNSGNEGNNGDTIPVKDKIEDYAGNWKITFQEDQLPDRPGGNIIIADDGSLTYPTVLGDKNINVNNNEIKRLGQGIYSFTKIHKDYNGDIPPLEYEEKYEVTITFTDAKNGNIIQKTSFMDNQLETHTENGTIKKIN